MVMPTDRPGAAGAGGVRYRFGELVLDVASYTLARAGQKVHVTPKVFDLLRHLIENRGRVVTKDELLDTLWADSHVNEGAVPWAINQARTAVGQDGRAKQPIETVYGRGYCFVAEVEVLPEPSSRGSVRPPPASLPGSLPAPQPWPAPPFVGRGQVMERLGARLAAAKLGSGSLCTLVGASGIGKTRAMEELAEQARAEGFDVWSGRSAEDLVAPSFWPFIKVLGELARDRPAQREAAQALLARLDGEDSEADAAGPTNATPAGTFWFFDGVASVLREAARQAPVLLVFDDLHWADAGTVQLLCFLAPELAQEAVLVIDAQREGRTVETRELRRLWRHAERIELPPLEPSDVGEYLSAMSSTPSASSANNATPHEALSAALHHATAGNPLYLVQTVRALIAEHGSQALSTLAPERIKPVKSAADILRSTLDPFDADARRVLEVASVLGEEFEVSTLQAVTETDAEAVLTALEAATQEGFVVHDSPNRMRFRHTLLRATLYEELTELDRAQLHRRAATVLEGAPTRASRSGEIAHHYYRSLALGDYARVTESAQLAGRAAERLQAFADAATFYRWALEAQGLDPDAQPRARAKLLLRVAQLERLAGRNEDAERSIERLDEHARRHGYWDLLVQAARVLRPTHLLGTRAHPRVHAMLEDVLAATPDEPSRVRISALSQLSWIPPYALDLQRSKTLSAQALALARKLGDEAALFEALHAQLYALSGPDDIDALLAAASEMQALDRSPPTWVTMEALAASHGALTLRGDISAAEAVEATIGRIAREQRWPEPIWTHDRLLAQRRALAGDFGTAEAALVDLKARALRMGLGYGAKLIDAMDAQLAAKRAGPQEGVVDAGTAVLGIPLHDIMASMRPGLALLCLYRGQRAIAKSLLENMVSLDGVNPDGVGSDGAALPKELTYLNVLANLALLAVDFADEARATRLYEALAPYPHHNTPNALMWYEGSVSHFLAVLARLLGRSERAGSHFDDALAMNEKLGLQPQLAQTCFEYARFLLGSARPPSRTSSGRRLQQRAIELADGVGMPWLAARARELP